MELGAALIQPVHGQDTIVPHTVYAKCRLREAHFMCDLSASWEIIILHSENCICNGQHVLMAWIHLIPSDSALVLWTCVMQKLVLTSPTSGDHSVDIVCSRTKATELLSAGLHIILMMMQVIFQVALTLSSQENVHEMHIHILCISELNHLTSLLSLLSCQS
jgi:hypothetical protein